MQIVVLQKSHVLFDFKLITKSKIFFFKKKIEELSNKMFKFKYSWGSLCTWCHFWLVTSCLLSQLVCILTVAVLVKKQKLLCITFYFSWYPFQVCFVIFVISQLRDLIFFLKISTQKLEWKRCLWYDGRMRVFNSHCT